MTGLEIDFGLLNPAVQEFLTSYTASEVTLIDTTTRSQIKNIIDEGVKLGKGIDEIAKDINNQYTMFSRTRSKLIAHNEVAQVHSQAEMLFYEESEVVDEKSWWSANDDKVSQGCMNNQAQGNIDFDKNFQSGHQTTPRHPRCRCVLIPQVAE